MLHPYLENTAKTVQYTFLWIGYALVQILVLYPLVSLPFWLLVLDGFVHALTFGVLGILLWSVIMYGNYSVLNSYQQFVNYVALGLLTILIWLGIGFGVFYLLYGDAYTSVLLPLLPVRSFLGVMIYLLIIQRFRLSLIQNEQQSEISDIQPVDEGIVPVKDSEIELLERIAVKSGTKIHVVIVPEIVYLQADGDYVQIYTMQGKYLKEQTMKYFEEHLPDHQFVRVHRSVIVNVEMISRIELYEKQNQQLTLKNGQQVKTSPAGYKALRGVLNL